jgi:hypothetical protein
MAERERLHSLGLHLGARAVTVLVVLIFARIAILAAKEPQLDPVGLIVMSAMVLMLAILFWTIWRTRPVVLDGDHLEVGSSGPRQRRIPLGDIVSVERPWWAFRGDIGAPLEITVRNGPSVHFFPGLIGAELLAARRADLAARAPKS